MSILPSLVIQMGSSEWRLGDSHFSEGWMAASLPGNVGKHHTRSISSRVGLEQETARVRRQEPAWLGRTSPASHEKRQKATFPPQPRAGTCLYPQPALQSGMTAPHPPLERRHL